MPHRIPTTPRSRPPARLADRPERPERPERPVRVPHRPVLPLSQHPRHRPELHGDGRVQHLVLGPLPVRRERPSAATARVGLVPLFQNLAQRGGVELRPTQTLARLGPRVDVQPAQVGRVLGRLNEPPAEPQRGRWETPRRRDAACFRPGPERVFLSGFFILTRAPERRAGEDLERPPEVRLGRSGHLTLELGVKRRRAPLARAVFVPVRFPVALVFVALVSREKVVGARGARDVRAPRREDRGGRVPVHRRGSRHGVFVRRDFPPRVGDVPGRGGVPAGRHRLVDRAASRRIRAAARAPSQLFQAPEAGGRSGGRGEGQTTGLERATRSSATATAPARGSSGETRGPKRLGPDPREWTREVPSVRAVGPTQKGKASDRQISSSRRRGQLTHP